MSDQWVKSLFSVETAHLTPLDFRYTAAAQFRFVVVACNFSNVSITNRQNKFAQDQLVSTRILSPTSFNDNVGALSKQFFALMDMDVSPSFSTELFATVIVQGAIHSAFNTEAFTTSVPGSNQYNITMNFYPLYDNANYTNVSTVPYKFMARAEYKRVCF